MTQHVFKELRTKKQMLATLAERANSYGWITNEQRQEIIAKLRSDVLTIGVIGQVKCGKSTFLNAFIFEDDVLPVATTIMTAGLSIVKYGEHKKIVTEFYTPDEWKMWEIEASRSLEDVKGNELAEKRVEMAQRMVKDAKEKLGASIGSYLGTTQDYDYDDLKEFVGKGGRFVSITKYVTIYYPEDFLNGVEIVDTPGFNDPVVSREEKTNDFLRKADVVVMLLSADRVFDATDRDILFKNVRLSGIEKVIIGINKYDERYSEATIEDLRDYTKEKIREACQKFNDDSLVELLKKAEPKVFSSLMALFSKLKIDKIMDNNVYFTHWKRLCDEFGINTQSEMREKSHLDVLASAVKQMIAYEKEQILFDKPINTIKMAGKEVKGKIDNLLVANQNFITDIKKPDSELDEKYRILGEIEKKIERKVDFLKDRLDLKLTIIVDSGNRDVQKKLDETIEKMYDEVDKVRIYQNFSKVDSRLDNLEISLIKYDLPKVAEQISVNAIKTTQTEVGKFIDDAEVIFMKNSQQLGNKDEVNEIADNMYIRINDEIYKQYKFRWNQENRQYKKRNWLGNIRKHSQIKSGYEQEINDYRRDFDTSMYLNHITTGKEEIINKVREMCITEVITPIREQIDDIRSSKESKEEQLRKAEEERVKLLSQKSEIERQMTEIEQQSAEIEQLLK